MDTRTPGTLRPLHAGASALALLAFEVDSIVEQVLAGPLIRYTEHTFDEPDVPRGRLRDIREAGIVTTTGEVDPHSTAIGAPVLFNRRLPCALGVAGPSVRFGDERVAEIVALVRAEADQLGRALSAVGGGS